MKIRYVKFGAHAAWHTGAFVGETPWRYMYRYFAGYTKLSFEERNKVVGNHTFQAKFENGRWIWEIDYKDPDISGAQFDFECQDGDALLEALNAQRFLKPVPLRLVRLKGCEMQVLKERTEQNDSRTKPDGGKRRSQGVDR